ncbi:MAG: hypothetical protein JXA49_05440, partial [Actinobacteria bacterium]|nr:hypothetical protein [Actinomycetota bacterium]
MDRKLTVAIYDWDGSERAVNLARAFGEDPRTARIDKLAVLPRGDSAAKGRFLSGLGFRTVVTADGSSGSSRKNLVLDEVETDLVLLSCEVELIDGEWLERLEEEARRAGGECVAGCKVVDESGLVVNAGNHVVQPDCEMFQIGGLKKDLNQYY